MGGRRISIEDPDKIVDDWPKTGPVGREKRKAEYRAQREALGAEKPVQPEPEYRGALPPPEIYFPEHDFVLEPWGPDPDDARVKAYCDIQWRAILKSAGVRKGA